jgi:hypothetical protein
MESKSASVTTNGFRIVESNIDGPFFGWSGSTVFKLANGQLWEQDADARMYHFAYRPNLTVTQTGDTHLMEVDRVGKKGE